MISETILAHLIHDEEYCRKIFPYLKEEYFETEGQKKIYDTLSTYITEYREPPTLQALKILLSNREDLNESSFKEIKETLSELEYDKDTNKEWLIKETEKHCQEMAFYNALKKCILIQEGSLKGYDRGSAPEIMSEALGISFDSHIGHDYFNDAENRYDFYHKVEERIPFDIDILNKITKGGLPRKSLVVYLAECVNENTKVKVRLKKKV